MTENGQIAELYTSVSQLVGWPDARQSPCRWIKRNNCPDDISQLNILINETSYACCQLPVASCGTRPPVIIIVFSWQTHSLTHSLTYLIFLLTHRHTKWLTVGRPNTPTYTRYTEWRNQHERFQGTRNSEGGTDTPFLAVIKLRFEHYRLFDRKKNLDTNRCQLIDININSRFG